MIVFVLDSTSGKPPPSGFSTITLPEQRPKLTLASPITWNQQLWDDMEMHIHPSSGWAGHMMRTETPDNESAALA
ncbi:hypothetical protein [Stigmatella ashevillensis]|uniref:hypothetical protein n=1 Tax=Stigmatella ashevillensis TaxID=2995309 RepID=UPI00233082A2|nr:hypothetical protein [Stigmatella ashevillena]